MFKFIPFLLSMLSICISTRATDREEVAVRTLQRSIRTYNSQTEKFRNLYKEGLDYRDGKVAGFKENSFEANVNAAVRFLHLAYLRDAKAQYNTGRIYYGLDWDYMAITWLEEAEKNQLALAKTALALAKMRAANKSDVFSQDGNLAKIFSYLDDNSFLAMRVIAPKWSQVANLVSEEIFSQRSPIKLCIEAFKEHPYPQTISYFIRKKLWDLEKLIETKDGKVVGGTPEACLKKIEQRAPSYQKCAEFCQEWKYPGAEIFRIMASQSPKDDSSKNTEASKSSQGRKKGKERKKAQKAQSELEKTVAQMMQGNRSALPSNTPYTRLAAEQLFGVPSFNMEINNIVFAYSIKVMQEIKKIKENDTPDNQELHLFGLSHINSLLFSSLGGGPHFAIEATDLQKSEQGLRRNNKGEIANYYMQHLQNKIIKRGANNPKNW